MIYVTFLVLVAATVFSTFDVNAQSTLECQLNEVKDPCGTRCEGRCNSPEPSSCDQLKCEGLACRCMSGFVRNQYNNRCVSPDECVVDDCAPGEVSLACGRTCEGTCDSPKEPEICQRIFCVNEECRCDLYGGFVRNNQTGKCVRIGEC